MKLITNSLFFYCIGKDWLNNLQSLCSYLATLVLNECNVAANIRTNAKISKKKPKGFNIVNHFQEQPRNYNVPSNIYLEL